MSTRRRGLLWLAVAAATAIAIAGLAVDTSRVAATFLVAYATAVSVALGMLALLMIAHLTTATWFAPFRPRAELVLRALPVLAAFGVLVLPALASFYRSESAADPTRRIYLNVVFLSARTIIYWIAWLWLAASLRASSRRYAAGDVARAASQARTTSSVGLVVLGFTMTFASFDWMMSLTPGWSSTAYGVNWFAGGVVGALALLGVLARFSLPVPVAADHRHALAKLLLTFVMFWVYVGFAQYIVIWSANVPAEVTWFVPRTRGGWGALALVLLIGGAAIPFVALLMRVVKRSPSVMAAIGGALLVAHYLDTYWMLMPGLVALSWWTLALSAAMLVVVVLPATAVAFRRAAH